MAERAAPPMKVLVGIPAYNAETRIEETIRRSLRQGVGGVLVVDDGSTDRTAQILDRLAAHEASITVIHQRNRGYGGAHKTILAAFERSAADVLVVLHGDGQHAPEEMERLLEALREGADVVLGSRALGHMLRGGMPLYKYVGNRVLTFIENVVFGTHISSFHCGYKACKREAAGAVPYHGMTDGFHFDGQFLVATCERGLKLAQVPVTTIYYRDGVSHLKPMRYLAEIGEFILCHWWSRLRRFARGEVSLRPQRPH